MIREGAYVTDGDIRALIHHYRTELARWSYEEPAMIAKATVCLAYWEGVLNGGFGVKDAMRHRP